MNPAAVDILMENPDRIDWVYLTENEEALQFYEEYNDKISLIWLSDNHKAIDILENNLDKISWYFLSSNKAAIDILEQNFDKIEWCEFSKNPAAIDILMENQDNIYWSGILSNTAAMDFIEYKIETKLLDDIYVEAKMDECGFWYNLCTNPSIFIEIYDVRKIPESIHKEEIAKKAFSPQKFFHYLNMGLDLNDF